MLRALIIGAGWAEIKARGQQIQGREQTRVFGAKNRRINWAPAWRLKLASAQLIDNNTKAGV